MGERGGEEGDSLPSPHALTKVIRLVPVRELLPVRGHDEGAVRLALHLAGEGEVERAHNVRPGHRRRGAGHLRAVPVARLGHELDWGVSTRSVLGA